MGESEKYCAHCMEPMGDSDICVSCGTARGSDTALPHQLLPGTILNGRYIVGRVLGEGGFGITYIGRDPRLELRVAIKEHFPRGYVNRNNTVGEAVTNNTGAPEAAFEKGKDRFMMEARILAKFQDEQGIVGVRDFFLENNTAYIVMDYLSGTTLYAYLAANGNLPADRVFEMMRPVLRSLERVHAQGLIHRDISPDNLMLMGDGSIRLLDFGATRDVTGEDNKSLSVMLKHGYAPEEQYRSRGNQGPWTDIYALCATIYRCITGLTPDDSTQRIFSDEVKTPSALGVNISPEREAALMRGMAISQKERFQSIGELWQAIYGERAADESPRPVEPAPAQKTQERPAVEDDNATYYGGGAPAPEEFPVPGAEPVSWESQKEPNPKPEHNPEPEAAPAPLPPENPPDKPLKRGPEPKGEKPPKKAEKQSKNEARISPDGAGLPEDELDERGRRKKKKRKKWGKNQRNIALAVVAAAILLIVYGAWQQFGFVNAGGQRIDKQAEVASFNSINVTAKDIKKLKGLPKMKIFRFSHCTLEDGAIAALNELKHLEDLEISDNQNSYDPSPLADSKTLNRLAIYNSPLSDETIRQIGEITRLTHLNLTGGTYSDISPIGNLDKLWIVGLNNITLTDYSALGRCTALRRIAARGAGITDISFISDLVNIEDLYLDDNKISVIPPLDKLTKLGWVELNNNEIEDISGFAGCGWLMNLELNNNLITDISALADCEKLRTLELDGNQVEDISALANCKKLGSLYMNGNRVSDLSPLTELSDWLSTVHFGGNQITNLDAFSKHIKLTIIDFSDNQITSIAPLSNCTQLTHVNFNNNQIEDISIMAKSADKLKRVQFNNNRISDVSAFSGCTALICLSLDGNNISDISPLAGVSLKGLSVQENHITSLAPLAYCEKLLVLDASENQVSDISGLFSSLDHVPGVIFDASNNQITSFAPLPADIDIGFLGAHGNPLPDYSSVKGFNGDSVSFTVNEDTDLTPIIDSGFRHFHAVDVPLDRQVEVDNQFLHYMGNTMSTSEEIKKVLDRVKDEAMGNIVMGSITNG